MSISSSYPTLRPSLLLDFSNSGRLDPRVTFTRASSATYFDATGTLQTATTDVPRFDYNPSTLAAQGLLIEESRTNQLLWSESLRTQTLTVTSVSGAFTDGETVTASGGGSGTYYDYGSTGSSFAIFQGSGTFTGTLTGSTSGQTATISSATGAWSVVSGATVNPGAALAPDGSVSANHIIESATSASRSVSQLFSLTAGTTITTSLFVKQAPGAARHFRIQTSSDVGTNGYRAYFDLTTGTVATQTAGFGTGTAVANSATITPVGNGWFRISASGTVDSAATSASSVGFMQDTTTGSAVYTGDGTSGLYVWGMAIERPVSPSTSAPFSTSYIPTTSAAVTRAADVASVNTLSPWYNAAEGTLYAEAQIAYGIASSPSVMAGLDDTTTNNRIQIRRQINGNVGDYRFVSSGGNFTGSVFSGTLNSINKQAAAYAISDQSGVVNGSLMTSITPIATLPTITRLVLGAGPGSSTLNGWLRRVSFYPRRLSDAELQAITT